MKRNLIIIAVLLFAAAAVIYNQAGDRIAEVFSPEPSLPVETGAKAGLLAPSFTLKGMDGAAYTGGGAREKALILNFWASWCGPCQEEAPELSRLAAKYADELDVYGVNVTKYDKEEKARAFAKEFKLSYPVLFDPKAEVFEKAYKGKVFPTNVLIDKNGVIREILLGAPDPETLEQKIRKLVR